MTTATRCQRLVDAPRALRCYYAADPAGRPDCQLTPTLRYGATLLCSTCNTRRSSVGKGQSARPVHAPELEVLDWIDTAAHDLHDAERTLHAAVRRARQRQHTWQSIGDRLGITRQAAQQRFNTHQDRLDTLRPWDV
ncbi:MAG TPA: hypothetical protein VLR26_01750 [Frankiaceae bacterium]|nr:hypothetical protein [Frankiaceae bacterium]